ncbi:MAG: L-threonylcarbamoyladenylate synthase, partial [Gammaproteobacteria bacterium]
AAIPRWASHIPASAQALARACWPGPMTLVLRRNALAGDWVTGAQDSVGLRVPAHPQAVRLLAAFARFGGEGVAAPSANRFGHVSPTTAAAVQEELGAYLPAPDTILDGGDCPVGIESTIIDCTGERPRILRPGAITRETIERVGGVAIELDQADAPRVSGSLIRHYAPLARVLLDATPQSGDGLIALADVPTPVGVMRLCEPRDPEAFAHDLYAALRRADALGLRRVVVIQPEGDGLAIALRDRLARAAEGREGEGGT